MRTIKGAIAGAAVAALLLPASASSGSARADGPPPPVVIAVVESGGMNVLHTDYRARGGDPVRLPRGASDAEVVELPAKGSFEERVEQLREGPLGNMEPGVLYRIKRTRIIGVYTTRPHDLTQDRGHATGTTSAAVGLRHGTNPNALLVFVADGSSAAWEWLEKQDWIDIVSTSYYTLLASGEQHQTCPARPSIRRIAEQGRVVFSAIGNGEQIGAAYAPSGTPESYQVGGVNDEGKWAGSSVPYETGDRYSFPSADADSLDGSMDFGGTSGATPSMAGRAAELIAFARSILSSDVGFSDGALATLGSGGSTPRRGPLKDGRLTGAELARVMHHTATPAEPPSPYRYLTEGYGAFQDEAMALARGVLAGTLPEPERPEEDLMHDAVETARSAFFPAPRCG